ncbi:MAG TPA: prolyl oligopeptidase family serine peptidase, partial [Prosthecobacter sp.]
MHRPLLLAFSIATLASAQLRPDGATASFKGSLPPKPTAALSAEQEAGIEKQLAAVTADFQTMKKHLRAADAEIFLKAVRYALDFDEWYDKKPEDGVKKATALLEEAKKRIASLKENKTPWMDGSGQKVLGFYSAIDGSAQPYGVEVPEGLEFGKGKKQVPMWIWLHGRGDTATDLHFVYSRLNAKKPGQFQPKGTIVIHPFGRYCNGWKSAGETDVFEARDDAKARFNVDENRIALAGFSMGGAGAWHIGAHFADQWACVHTGAGFVDVKRYQKLTPEKMPPWYEQTLWGVYDVPDYARNFMNVPLISYSGENDSQRDSAEYMTEVLAKEGITRPHLIGPGMGHKYHPEVAKEVQALVERAVEKGRTPPSARVNFSYQTRTLEYPNNLSPLVEINSLEEHWKDSRLDSQYDAKTKALTLATVNLAELQIDPAKMTPPVVVEKLIVDGQDVGPANVQNASSASSWKIHKETGKWSSGGRSVPGGLSKKVLTGPMDAAFLDSFLVVLPDGESPNKAVAEWVNIESQHFIARWRSLMRGDPKV